MRKYVLLSLLLSTCISVHSQIEYSAVKKDVNSWCADITSALLSNGISANSQNEFASIKNEVDGWYAEIASVSTSSSKDSKSIDFTAKHYLIDGVVTKGILVDGTIAKFYDMTSLIPNLLLEGRVSYQTNRLVIKGIKYDKTPVGINKIYGSFYVYNMDDYSMNYKPKKAGALRIKCSEASYLEGFYLKSPVIVRLQGKNTVFVDGKTGGRGCSFLSAKIPSIALNDDDSFDMYQILLQANNDVIMRWDDGATFKGRVKPTIKEDSTIVFRTLDGQFTGRTSGPKKITLSLEKGNIIRTQEDDDDNKLLSKEIMYVKDDGTLSDMDYWNANKIYENCYLAKWTYRNGNYFEGSIKSVVSTDRISSTATKGIFKYTNGDRFEGDLSSKTVGPFFVDGTTMLADGTKLKGNWLEKYKLSNNQLTKVYNCKNPSDAIAIAKQFAIENDKQAKEDRYNSLVDSVKALGETKYQKALISWRDRYLKQLENECRVSATVMLGGLLIGAASNSVTNQITLGEMIAPIVLEAFTKRPMACKSITERMAAEIKQIEKLALPIEIELEKLQTERKKGKKSTSSQFESDK